MHLCAFFFTSARCSRKRSANLLPVSPMTFAEMHVKWSVILTDRFRPENLTMLEIKGQALYRVRVHLKVPGWLSELVVMRS